MLIVGIGTGLDLVHIPAEAKVTGIDLSADMLRRAGLKAAHRDCVLRQMNAERLDFDDKSFDVVIMNYVLSVVADPAKALSEAARVLAPSGSIWILGKFYESAPGRSRRALSSVLTAIGGAELTRSLTSDDREDPTSHRPARARPARRHHRTRPRLREKSGRPRGVNR